MTDYHRAVIEAYKMRDHYDQYWRHLSFDPFIPISVDPNLLVCKYSTFCVLHGEEMRHVVLSVSGDGFTIRKGKHHILCYNDSDTLPETRKRFTLAHELGHYVLGHRRDGEAEEREANCFARNILAPRVLAIKYGLNFDDYPLAFGISPTAAQICADKQEQDELYLSEILDTFPGLGGK